MSVKNRLYIFLILLSVVFPTTSMAQADYDAEQEAAERIQRQLELANELRAKRLQKQREKEQQLQQEEQLEKHCNRLKDELRRMDERRRWYRLDENGERIYISEAEVRQRKQSLQTEYDRRCEEYR